MAPPLALTEVRRIVEEEQDALRRLSEEEALLGGSGHGRGQEAHVETAFFYHGVRGGAPQENFTLKEHFLSKNHAPYDVRHLVGKLSSRSAQTDHQQSAKIWFSTSAGRRKRRPAVLRRSASALARRVAARRAGTADQYSD